MIQRAKHFYEFGRFRIDERERVLLREGQPVPARPQGVRHSGAGQRSGARSPEGRAHDGVVAGHLLEESSLTYKHFTVAKGGDGHGERYIETIPPARIRFGGSCRKRDWAGVVEVGSGDAGDPAMLCS